MQNVCGVLLCFNAGELAHVFKNDFTDDLQGLEKYIH